MNPAFDLEAFEGSAESAAYLFSRGSREMNLAGFGDTLVMNPLLVFLVFRD